jgi:hypothetical protein
MITRYLQAYYRDTFGRSDLGGILENAITYRKFILFLISSGKVAILILIRGTKKTAQHRMGML